MQILDIIINIVHLHLTELAILLGGLNQIIVGTDRRQALRTYNGMSHEITYTGSIKGMRGNNTTGYSRYREEVYS